jgi:hypothetical protein
MFQLKGLLILLAALAAAGGAVSAQRIAFGDIASAGEERVVDACYGRLRSSPPFLALKHRLVPTDVRLADVKATAEEVGLLLDYHLDFLWPCRKLELEAAGRQHPALVEILAETYARLEASAVELVAGRVSWAEWLERTGAVDAWTDRQLVAVRAWLGGGRDSAFTRQAALNGAAIALHHWTDRQRTLMQQSRLIAPASLQRFVTCLYVGSRLECTSS